MSTFKIVSLPNINNRQLKHIADFAVKLTVMKVLLLLGMVVSATAFGQAAPPDPCDMVPNPTPGALPALVVFDAANCPVDPGVADVSSPNEVVKLADGQRLEDLICKGFNTCNAGTNTSVDCEIHSPATVTFLTRAEVSELRLLLKKQKRVSYTGACASAFTKTKNTKTGTLVLLKRTKVENRIDRLRRKGEKAILKGGGDQTFCMNTSDLGPHKRFNCAMDYSKSVLWSTKESIREIWRAQNEAMYENNNLKDKDRKDALKSYADDLTKRLKKLHKAHKAMNASIADSLNKCVKALKKIKKGKLETDGSDPCDFKQDSIEAEVDGIEDELEAVANTIDT